MMHCSITSLILTGIVILCLAGGGAAQPEDPSATIYQVSSWGPFEEGDYTEVMSVDDLKELGTLGIGGYEDLNGELLELDGEVWQITHDGVVSQPSGDTGVCFATTVRFDPSLTLPCNETTSRDDLFAMINQSFPDHDTIYAYRIDGDFSRVEVRSIPPQTQPYPPLPDVIARQTIFPLSGVSGSVGGFWFPDWMQGVNAAGFHSHFLTSGHDAGGHLLNCTAENVTISIQPIHRFAMVLPD